MLCFVAKDLRSFTERSECDYSHSRSTIYLDLEESSLVMYETGSQAKETPGLEDYLAAIGQRKLLILVCAVLGVVLAVLFTLSRQPTFEAAAKVVVNPTNVGSTDGRLVRPTLEREREIVDSEAVARLVAVDLGLTTSPLLLLRDLEVVFVDNSDTLELLYQSSDSAQAQEVVNSFAVQYVDQRVGQSTDLHNATIEPLSVEVDRLQVAIDEAQAEIDDTVQAQAVATASGNAALAQSLAASATEFRTNRNALRQLLNAARSDLQDATIARDTQTVPAEVLERAAVPTSPVGFSDNILRAAGLVLGLGLGVALAFVLHRLDRTARESSDVELALGTSVLASIPSFGMAHRNGSAAIVMLAGGRSAKVQRAREAFRRLRSSLQFLGTTRDADTFLITSARPSEGKSTTVANLAIALAQGETKVCLVNADLRRPTIEKVLGISGQQQGLSDWLVDQSITNIMVSVQGTPGLVVVPSGQPPTNPGELLATGRIKGLIDELSTQFDIVLVDAPPVLNIADASSIAPSVDGTIIVVDSSRTDTDTLLRVRSEIDRAGGNVVGAILNRDDSDTGRSVLRKDRYAYEKVGASRAKQ